MTDSSDPRGEDTGSTAGLRTAFKIGRAADDPEKAILPAILYCNADHAFFSEHRQRGFAIAIGWWDFYLFAAFIATTADLTSTNK